MDDFKWSLQLKDGELSCSTGKTTEGAWLVTADINGSLYVSLLGKGSVKIPDYIIAALSQSNDRINEAPLTTTTVPVG